MQDLTLPARLERVLDGDTQDLIYSLGFGLLRRARVRLAGVDAAETYGVPTDSAEYREGERHTRFVQHWYAAAAANPSEEWPLRVHPQGPDKYGRDLVRVLRVTDGQCLKDALVEAFPGTAA